MTSLPVDGAPAQTAATPSLSSVLKDKLPGPIQAILDAQQKQKWAAWANNEFVKCKNARATYERQWHINLAFYRGKHYISPINVPGSGFRLIAPKAPPWRVRMVINKIRTAIRTECAKLTSNKPVPTVIPATSEDEDFASARVAEQLLKSKFNEEEFDQARRRWIWWGSVCGNSFMKSYWDASAIDEEAQNNEPQTVQTPMGPMQMPPQTIYGKIQVEVVTPFHLYVPDLLSESIEEQPYVIHVTTKSPLWVQSRFGFMPTADVRAAFSINEAAFLTASGNQHLDAVLVKEVWLKPNAHPDFPEGGLLTIINDRCVQVQQKWPWPFKTFPFYEYRGIPTGEFYCDSVIVDLIPIQKEYNRTKSQMIEIKNLMQKPKFLYAKGSMNPRQISSEPGQGIPYIPGMPVPTILNPPEIPVTMAQELDRLSSDFDDISGQHEITRGNTPAQVTSGTAISFLAEQDDSKLAYQIASIEAAIQKLGKHYLHYVSNFWDQPRLVKIVGTDQDFEARMWQGSDLRGNTDVRVQAGSALPQSKAAKAALLTEWMQNGWIAPVDGLEMMDMAGLDKLMEDFLIDKRQAQRENLKLAEAPAQEIAPLVSPPVGQDGQPVMGPDPTNPQNEIPYDPVTNQPWAPQPPLPVNSWDNHQAHIQFHNNFRKTQQFELLDDAIKQAFELHVQAHQMALSMPQMGQAGIVSQPGMQQGLPGGEPGNATDPNAAPPGGGGQQGGPPPPPNGPPQ